MESSNSQLPIANGVFEFPNAQHKKLSSMSADNFIKIAPSIPSIAYKPSADCAYSMLVTKITGRTEKVEIKENVPSPDTTSQPREESSTSEAPSNDHAYQMYPQQGGVFASQMEIAKGPVLYGKQAADSQTTATNLMKLEEPELSTFSGDFSSNTNSPKPDLKPKSSALGLTQYYNSDDTDSDCDSQSESIEVPPESEQVIVDKMASYVAKNGDEFETIVKMKGDPRFCFLDSNHKYYKYYKHKVEFYKRAGKNPGDDNSDNQYSTGVGIKKDAVPKAPKVIAPVSFCIKKIKEPEPVLPKPALPYESSSEDEENKDENITKVEVQEATSSEVPDKESAPEESDNVPQPQAIIQDTDNSIVHEIPPVPIPIALPVPKIEAVCIPPPMTHIPIIMPVVYGLTPIVPQKTDIKKDIQQRIQELSSPSSSETESKSKHKKSRSRELKSDMKRKLSRKSRSRSPHYEKRRTKTKSRRSRSKSPKLKKTEKASKSRSRTSRVAVDGKQNEKIKVPQSDNKVEIKNKSHSKSPKKGDEKSIPAFIDLTSDLYDLADCSCDKTEGEMDKIKIERKKKAAVFLSALKTTPTAPLHQYNTLASAMVKTLHSIQEDGETSGKRKHKSSSDRRKSKKHKRDRDRSHSSDSDYDKNRDYYRHKKRSHHHSKKSKKRSRDRSSSRHRRKSRDRESSRCDDKSKAIELPKVDEDYISARQKNKLLTSSLKDLVREARKDLSCSEPIKMAVDIFAKEPSATPSFDKERSRSKTVLTTSSSSSSDSDTN